MPEKKKTEVEDTGQIHYRLFVKDRFAILDVLPRTDIKVSLLLVSEALVDKVMLNEEERKKVVYKEVGPGQITWDMTKDFDKVIYITDEERSLLVSQLNKLVEENKINFMHLNLYKHFVLGKNTITELTEQEAKVALSSGTLAHFPKDAGEGKPN